jgi:signal transduction histidine kinase
MYLLLSSIALLINSLGYLLEIKSETEESMLSSLKFSYLGRVWYSFFLFLFVAELVGVKMPGILKKIQMLLNTLIYVTILGLPDNKLYYTDIHFSTEGIFPKLYHGNGIMHHVLMVVTGVYIVVGFSLLLIAYQKERKTIARHRLFTIILAVLVEGAFFIMQMAGIRGLTDFYDVTMMGYFIGTIIMLIAIFQCDLLGTREIVREYLIDRISEGVIAVDSNGEIQFFNEPAVKLFPQLVNKAQNITKQYENSPEQNEILETIRKAIAEGSSLTIEDRIYTPEENELIYGGEVYGKLYALVDDTDHYRYMEELKEQRQIADSANEAKSRFLANMSHEIRTPINAVLGLDEMILRETTEKGIRSYSADIMAAGKTLMSLINDILDLSKVEEGKMKIIPVQYEVSSLGNDLVNIMRDRAIKKGLRFVVDADEHIPHILIGDEIRIRQCVLNLLTNAVKYTESGSVTLKVSFDKKDDNHIMLNIAVEDTGIGMRKEDMEALFSPYERIEEKRNRTIEGTGLGMSITRHLLELMGSELEVQSEYGKGSNISFRLEQEVVSWTEVGDYNQRLSDSKSEEGQYHELFHAPEARILVVDDTEMNLTVMKSLLKKTQIRFDTARSGADAVTLAASNE